ncbi:MAG: phosphoribosylformylglycinamidine synthase II, partial [Sphingomonadales bacterium]
LKDWSKSCTIGFKGTGDIIIALGERGGHLGQSIWLREVHGREEGPPPPVDLMMERRVGAFVRSAICKGAITACHDVSDGGLAVTVAEMALASNIGAIIDQPQPFGIAGSFFGEDQGLYVITVADELLADFLVAADNAGLAADPIGRTIKDRLIFELEEGDHCVSIADLRAAHEGFFPALMGEDGALA